MSVASISSGLQNIYSTQREAQPQATSPTASASASPSTVVTLSAEALARSRHSDLPEHIQNRSDWLRNNPDQQEAARYVEMIATTPNHELVSIAPGSDGIKGVYYKSGGAPVTEQSRAWFKDISETALAERTRIYDSENAKGTPPADIYDKIQQYMSTLPPSYLHMMNWYGSKPA